MIRVISLLLMLALSANLRAEVRVVDEASGAKLVIRPSGQGVWTPVREGGRGYLLNVEGDALGDSHPGHSESRGRVVVAWTRPAGELHVADVDDSGALWHRVLDSPNAIGTPLVVPVGSSQAIIWVAGGDDAGIYLAYYLDNGQVSSAIRVDEGSVVAAVPHGDSALLVVRDAALGQIRIWVAVNPTPVPIPIPGMLLTAPLRQLSSRGASAVNETPQPCVVADADTAVIGWKTGPGSVAVLTIDQGVAYDIEYGHGGNACQAAGSGLR